MSGERTTSRAEAAVLRTGINECVDTLERHGFDRGQIGAAMAGIGLALTQVHLGHERALDVTRTLQTKLEADAAGRPQ